jgi:hypothetical protein
MLESEKYAMEVFRCVVKYPDDPTVLAEAEKIFREHTADMERENYLLFFQNKLGGVTVDLHLEWWELLKNPRVCLLAPRNSGKSFFFVIGYILWNMYFRRHKLIYIFSDSSSQAMDLLSRIKDQIDNNPELSWLKPSIVGQDEDWTGKSWAKAEIKSSNGVRVKTKGFGSAIRGPHPGLIILDDVLNDEDPMTVMGRAKADKYFKSAVSNMLQKSPKSQLIMVGTAQHYKDLLHIHKDNPAYKWKKYKAIINERTRQVLIPERWSYSELIAKKKEIGSLAFAKEFQNEPLDEESTIFAWDLMKLGWDVNYKAPLKYDGKGIFRTFLGADFSVPGCGSGDWTVVLTIGVTASGSLYLFDIFRGRGLTFTEQVDVVMERMERYSVQRGFLESNMFQQVYTEIARGMSNLPLYGHNVSSHNKNSLLIGVPSIVVLFENLKAVLPYHPDDGRGRLMTEKLCEELHSFRMMDGRLGTVSDHDDIAMALWHAISASREQVQGACASRQSLPILHKGNSLIRKQELSDLFRRGYKPDPRGYPQSDKF